MRALARFLFEHGFIAIPTKDKKPLVNWGEFLYRYPTREEIEELVSLITSEFAILTGTPLGLGYLVIIDIDDWALWPKEFLIPNYYTKTPNGFHIPVRARIPIQTKHFGGIDILGINGLAMFPGSITSEGMYIGKIEYYLTPRWDMPANFLESLKKLSRKRKIPSKVEEEPKKEQNNNRRRITAQEVAEIIKPYWIPGNRHNISLAVAAFFRRRGFSARFVERVLSFFEDEESRKRQIIETYKKPIEEIASYQWAPEVIEALKEYLEEENERPFS